MTWFAIHSDSRELVATGDSYMECSDKAHKKLPWGNSPKGEVLTAYENPTKSKEIG